MSATPRSIPGTSRYKWGVVALLWFFCFFNYADRQAIFSIFPVLKKEYGFDAVQLGLIGSAFTWIYAAGSPFAGLIGDRLSRRFVILGSCFFWSGATVATAWCGRLWQFLTVRAAQGFGETFYYPAAASLMSDYHGRRTRSFAFSLHQSSVYIGTIGGSWAGAWFAERHGWRSGFYFFGAAGLVLALIFLRFLREPVRGAADELTEPQAEPLAVGPTLRVIFSRPTAVLLMLAFLAANFVATIFLTWTPSFLVDKFHYNLTAAGLSGSVFIHVASGLAVPIGGWLADRLSRRFAGGRIFVQAFGLLVGAGFVALVGLTRNSSTLIGAMVAFGLCKGLYDSNIFASLYDFIEPRARATAVGIMNSVGWCGGAFGPLAIGFATKYGRHGADTVANMSEAIAFGSVFYIIGGVILLYAGLVSAKRDMALQSAAAERVPVA
ncbi:MAG TPA: MFS transporter [Opitutaceae bacterium]|nr:MFS transporter [Opitutaceae bacterium]